MNLKIERVCKDIDKTRSKIGELQARLRELESQRTELENTEIVETVPGHGYFPCRSGRPAPGSSYNRKIRQGGNPRMKKSKRLAALCAAFL